MYNSPIAIGVLDCWREMFAVAREKEVRPNNEFVPYTTITESRKMKGHPEAAAQMLTDVAPFEKDLAQNSRLATFVDNPESLSK